MAKARPQSKMLGRSSNTSCILKAEPADAELPSGQPHGSADEPEAGHKQLQMRSLAEIHNVYVGERTWSSGQWRFANCCNVLCMGFTSGGNPASPGLQKHLIQNICWVWRTA